MIITVIGWVPLLIIVISWVPLLITVRTLQNPLALYRLATRPEFWPSAIDKNLARIF